MKSYFISLSSLLLVVAGTANAAGTPDDLVHSMFPTKDAHMRLVIQAGGDVSDTVTIHNVSAHNMKMIDSDDMDSGHFFDPSLQNVKIDPTTPQYYGMASRLDGSTDFGVSFDATEESTAGERTCHFSIRYNTDKDVFSNIAAQAKGDGWGDIKPSDKPNDPNQANCALVAMYSNGSGFTANFRFGND